MASIKDLDTRLEELRRNAEQQDRVYKSSKQLLYGNLVDTYLWWREARKKDGYIEARLAERKIGDNKKNSNLPNFNPILKLVLGMRQHVDAVQISNWGKAMNAIDFEYLRNEHIYKNRDTAAELIDWINDNRGLAGITGNTHKEVEERGFDPKDAGVKRKQSEKEKAEKRKRLEDVLEMKRIAVGQLETGDTFDIGEVGTGEQNLVLVLAQATGEGSELRVISTTAKQGLVDGAILETNALDLSAVPSNVRLLCEAVNMNTLTKAQQDYGARKKYYGTAVSKIDGETFKRAQQPRVVLRKNGTIMVSRASTKASITTFHIPNERTELDKDYWLRGSDRNWLETDLVNDSEIVLYDAIPAVGVAEQKNKKIKASKQITLTAHNKKHERNLYFYECDMLDDTIAYQPTITDDSINYDWAIKGNKKYFERLLLQHFDGWQHKVKHRVATANNKAVCFDVGENGIIVEAKWSKQDRCFTQTGMRYFTAFSDDADTCGTGRTMFAPTDLIPVLETLRSSNIVDDVVMLSGNADVMYMNYKTDLAEVQVFIPACNETGKRAVKYFKKFETNG